MWIHILTLICGIIGAIFWFNYDYWSDEHLWNICFGFLLGYGGSWLIILLIYKIIDLIKCILK